MLKGYRYIYNIDYATQNVFSKIGEILFIMVLNKMST